MNLKRVALLLYKEFVQSPKNFFFTFAIIVPVVMTLVITLLFGSLFSGRPKLGIADAGESQFTAQAEAAEAFTVKEYPSEADLKRATEIGGVDIGVSLPADFDQQIASGELTHMTAYIWGESMIKNRAMLAAGIASWVREVAGQDSPIEIVPTTLGNLETLSWEERLLPLIVMMCILLGGVMVPSSSLVKEKQEGTLTALSVTPTTLGDIFTAKALLGVILSTLTGVLILALNRSFGINPGLLVLLLFLGAVMAAEIGVLMGALIKDINTLFATIKSAGILLYAPAIVYMFPAIPQWIAKIFPTNYMVAPVIEVTQKGAGWSEIAWQVYLLVGFIVLLGALIALVARRMRQRDN